MPPSQNTHDVILDSPVGKLGVQLQDNRIIRLDYLGNRAVLTVATTPLGRKITKQLANYFANPLSRFTVAFQLHGTDFQQRVWQALTRIPAGKTLTYGELADRLGSGARAVGNACRNNPVSIIVPCHRVVGAAGIGGYSGKTNGREINRKQWLLSHEGIAGQALKIGYKPPNSTLQQKLQRNLPA